MGFFLVGYVFFDVILLIDLPCPVEPVTAGVFLGGAIFVFIISNLVYDTIKKILRFQNELETLNASLEMRVAERISEVENAYDLLLKSRKTLQTILNAMPYGVIIIGRDKIIRSGTGPCGMRLGK